MRIASGIVLLICVALAAAGCGVHADADRGIDVADIRSRVDVVGYSRFDDAGVEKIKESRIVKLDVRSGAVSMDSVGMTETLGPAIGGASEHEMLLVFDGPEGRQEVVSRTLMVLADEQAGLLAEVTYWRSAQTLDDAFSELRDGIHRWGFSEKRINNWIKEVSADRKTSGKYVLSMGVSPSGLITQVEVKYDPGKPVVLRYMLQLLPALRDPWNIEAIRRTGQRDFSIPMSEAAPAAGATELRPR